MNFFSPLLTLATLAVAISVGNGEDCNKICTDDDGDSGVRICRPKGKSGKWHTQCVDSATFSFFQDKDGAVCGCCNPEYPGEVLAECPTDGCSDGNSETCSGENDSVRAFDGHFMCQQYGNPRNSKFKTQCIEDGDPSIEKLLKGYQCGCCDKYGVIGDCPEMCTNLNSAECKGEDDEDGHYVCRTAGKATFPPTTAPTTDALALEPLPKGFKNVCVPNEDILSRQLKGDKCGCCGVNDGKLSVSADNCPTLTKVQWVHDSDAYYLQYDATAAGCSASMYAAPCDLEEEDGGTIPDGGNYICRLAGKTVETVCVSNEESIDIQLKGGQCGCCNGSCSGMGTPLARLRTRQHAGGKLL